MFFDNQIRASKGFDGWDWKDAVRVPLCEFGGLERTLKSTANVVELFPKFEAAPVAKAA